MRRFVIAKSEAYLTSVAGLGLIGHALGLRRSGGRPVGKFYSAYTLGSRPLFLVGLFLHLGDPAAELLRGSL